MRTLAAIAAVVALVLAPQALSAGYVIVTEHSPSQNRIDRLNETPVVTGTTDGFQWGDAGIGASAALGLVLLISGTTLVVARRRGNLAF